MEDFAEFDDTGLVAQAGDVQFRVEAFEQTEQSGVILEAEAIDKGFPIWKARKVVDSFSEGVDEEAADFLREFRLRIEHQESAKEILESFVDRPIPMGRRLEHGYSVDWDGTTVSLRVVPSMEVWAADVGGATFKAARPTIAISGAIAQRGSRE